MKTATDKKSGKWEKVGDIGVDAGLCWLGDPCYILHAKPMPVEVGKDWGDFCDRIKGRDTAQFRFDLGHAGLGVVVSTGWGDGCYPVEVRRVDGRIAEVRVRFID